MHIIRTVGDGEKLSAAISIKVLSARAHTPRCIAHTRVCARAANVKRLIAHRERENAKQNFTGLMDGKPNARISRASRAVAAAVAVFYRRM